MGFSNFAGDMEKADQKPDRGMNQACSEKMSLEEIERGWQEYLSRSPEEREQLKDPFLFSGKDLHLNECCRIIPNQFREKVKFAETDQLEEDMVVRDFELKLKLFLAAGRPWYPTMKNTSTWQ